ADAADLHQVGVAAGAPVLLHVLLVLAVGIVCRRLLGQGFAYLRQPSVSGEIIAGSLLGPSLLSWLSPDAYEFLLRVPIVPFLGLIAQLGIILYMFLVGLELDLGRLRHRVHVVIATSHASIVVPLVLGAGLALVLYPSLSTSTVPFTSFALFM